MLRRRHEAIAPRLRGKTTGKEESRKRRRIKIYHRSGSCPLWRSGVAECVRWYSLRLSARCRPVRLSSVAEYVRRYSLRLSVSCRPLWLSAVADHVRRHPFRLSLRLSPSVGSPSALALCPPVRLYSVPECVGWYFVRLSFRGRPVRLSVGLSSRLRGGRVGHRPTYQTGGFVGELATGGTG